MKWFFALNGGAPHFEAYADMVRAAVLSARRHTRLDPHFLGDDVPESFTRWLLERGVTVVPARWRMLDEYREVARRSGHLQLWDYAAGVFLRTEVPRLCAERGWSDERVLYTDCDILFTGDPEPLFPDLRGAFFGVAPEEDPQDAEAMNSGVMLMNVPALLGMDRAFEEFVRRNLEACAQGTDQYAYRAFFRRGWAVLPPELNWKPYWGENAGARIVHFHGPKPFLRASIASGEAAPVQREMARGAFYRYCDIWDRELAGDEVGR